MIRIDSIESCAEQHKINFENLIYKKNNEYRTFNEKININSLENIKKINLLNKINNLKEKFSNIKNKLNDYVRREQLLIKIQNLKNIINLKLLLLNKITFNDIDLKINDLNSKLNKIKNNFINFDYINKKIQNLNDKYKIKNFDNKFNNIINKINNIKLPNTVDSLSISKIELYQFSGNFKIYDGNHCYIDIPISNKNLIYVSLYFKTYKDFYMGSNSIYYIDNHWRIYLYNITKDFANENIIVNCLTIKDKNANKN